MQASDVDKKSSFFPPRIFGLTLQRLLSHIHSDSSINTSIYMHIATATNPRSHRTSQSLHAHKLQPHRPLSKPQGAGCRPSANTPACANWRQTRDAALPGTAPRSRRRAGAELLLPLQDGALPLHHTWHRHKVWRTPIYFVCSIKI